MLFSAQCHDLPQLICAHLCNPILTAAHNCLCQSFLGFNHVVNHLLQRSRRDKLVHLHIALLTNAEGAVCSLVFDGGIPPAIKVKDVVGACQVQACATCLQ